MTEATATTQNIKYRNKTIGTITRNGDTWTAAYLLGEGGSIEVESREKAEMLIRGMFSWDKGRAGLGLTLAGQS